MRKIIITLFRTMSMLFLICNTAPQEATANDGCQYLSHDSKQYEIMQYKITSSLNIYSLQDWGRAHKPIVLIKNQNQEIVKMIKNADSFYYPDVTIYDLNGDECDDIILFWHIGGGRAQGVEVWINKNNIDFYKVFDDFAGKGAEFTVINNIPTLSLDIYTDHRIDKEIRIYKWNGKTFEGDEIQFAVSANHWWDTRRK